MSVPIRVLLVDDEPMFLAAVSALLDTDDRVEVVGTAADGYEALALAGAQRPDVVLVDLRLPQMDGFEIMRRLLAHEPRLKLIAVSGVGDESAPDDARAAGATHFLLKGGLDHEIGDAIVAVSTEPFQTGA